MGAGSAFAWQHDARRQPDGTLTLFDNGAAPAVEKLSRGLILDARRAGDDGDAARAVHAPGDPRRQPGQRAAAGQRQRVRRLGRSAARLRVRPRRAHRLRRGARRELPVLQGVSPAVAAPVPPRPPRSRWPATAASRRCTRAGTARPRCTAGSCSRAHAASGCAPVASVRSQRLRERAAGARAGPLVAVRALDAAGRPLGQSRTLTLAMIPRARGAQATRGYRAGRAAASAEHELGGGAQRRGVAGDRAAW